MLIQYIANDNKVEILGQIHFHKFKLEKRLEVGYLS